MPELFSIKPTDRQLAENLKAGHERWTVGEARRNAKYFEALMRGVHLLDEYRARRTQGKIPAAFDWAKNTTYKSDADAAHAWAEFELQRAEHAVHRAEEATTHETQPETHLSEPVVREQEQRAETLHAPTETTHDIRPPEVPAFAIDISEIVRRMAMTQAEEKLHAYKNRWRHHAARASEQSTPELDQPQGRLARLWRGTKEVTRAVGRTIHDAITHPAEFAQSVFVRTAEKAYLDKFYNETLAEIQTNQNLMAEISARIRTSGRVPLSEDKLERHAQVLDNIIEQYTQEVAEAHEKGEKIHDEDVNVEVGALMYEYAVGDITDRAAFDARVHEVVIPIMKHKGYRFHAEGQEVDETKTGLMYATNFFELAQAYKGYLNKKIQEFTAEHGAENADAIKNHVRGLLALDIQLGLKERDIRDTKPESLRTRFDQFIDWAQARAQTIPVLGRVFAMPVTYAAGGSAAATLAIRNVASRSLGKIVAAPIVGALFGGFMGALRRGRDLQYDRGMELRRQALGQEAGGARAVQVREYAYNMRTTEEVVERLNTILGNASERLSPEDTQYVAELYARLGVEQTANVDLFRATAEEGSQLGSRVKSMTEIKTRLRRLRERHPDLAPEALQPIIARFSENFQDHIAQYDSAFRDFRKKEMWKAAAFGATTGLGVGALAQAGVMAIRGDFKHSMIGELGQWMRGTHAIPAEIPSGTALHEALIPGTTTKMRLPAGMTILRDGTAVSLIDTQTGTTVADHLTLDAHNHLNSADMETLKNMGWHIAETNTPADTMLVDRGVHEMLVPGGDPNIDFGIKLPVGFEIEQHGAIYNIVDTIDHRTVFTGLALRPDGLGFTPASEKIFHAAGWDFLQEKAVPTHHTIDDADEITAYARHKFGGDVVDPTRRNWHGNVDPRTREVTWTTNNYWHNKLSGGVHENYPYDFKATMHERVTSGISVNEHILNKSVAVGEHITGHLIEGKELRVQLLDAGGEYKLDFPGLRDMVRHGAKNFDGSYDEKFWQIKQVLRAGKLPEVSKHFRFRFYVDKEHFQKGEAFSLQVGPDGAIHIPKGSELAQMLVEQRGKVPHLRLTGETALYTNHGVAHVFATKLGKPLDELRIAGTAVDAALTPPHAPATTVYDFFPPPADTLPPFIPLPFVPRKDVEAGRRAFQPLSTYPYYYVRRGENDPAENLSRLHISPRLLSDPQAKLDATTEITDYLNQNKHRYNEIKSFNQKINEVMDPACKIVVCIPCASHKEGKNIYNTLRQYTYQVDENGHPLDPRAFEVIVFLNRPKGTTGDASEKEVERFKREYPKYKIRVMNEQTEWGSFTQWGEQVNLNSVCRRIYDVAALRAVERTKEKDVIILTADADLEDMSPHLLQSYMTEFEHDAEHTIDAITGDVDWGSKLMRMPTLFAVSRFWHGIDKQLFNSHDVNRKIAISWGANFAIRASSYAAIGGRRDDIYLSDVELGRRLVKLRRPKTGNYTHQNFPLRYRYRLWLDSNPRRLVLAHKQGFDAIQLYRGKEDPELEKKSLDELIGQEQPTSKIDVHRVEDEINRLIQIYQLDMSDASSANDEGTKGYRAWSQEVVAKSAKNVGIQYEIRSNGSIHITSMTEFQRKLQQARSGRNFFESLPDASQGR